MANENIISGFSAVFDQVFWEEMKRPKERSNGGENEIVSPVRLGITDSPYAEGTGR